MDELLLKQLIRQLKIMNFWITLFGTLFLIVLIILGVLIFKMVTFVHSTEQKISDFQTSAQSTLDLQAKLCKSKSLGSLLTDKTSACDSVR